MVPSSSDYRTLGFLPRDAGWIPAGTTTSPLTPYSLMNTQITSATVHENSISLDLLDRSGERMVLTIPLPNRSHRADVEDRLLSAGVLVSHS